MYTGSEANCNFSLFTIPAPNIMSSWRDTRNRMVKDVGFYLLQKIERLVGMVSLVGDQPIHNPEEHPTHFGWIDRIEANWKTIREELDQVLEERDLLPNFQDISKDQQSITDDDRWKTFFLYGFGHKAEENCARCPKTTQLVESVPGMRTAFFSILAPGKHIPAHRGPYKGVLRYHLGLKVPEPAMRCRIRVNDEYAHWREGESLLFDDTYDHEVWNDTDGERAVLFMDVVRPLAEPWDTINQGIIWLVGQTPFVQEAKKNQEQWMKRRKERPASEGCQRAAWR